MTARPSRHRGTLPTHEWATGVRRAGYLPAFERFVDALRIACSSVDDAGPADLASDPYQRARCPSASSADSRETCIARTGGTHDAAWTPTHFARHNRTVRRSRGH